MAQEVVKSAFKKPATVPYPYQKIDIPKFRGRIEFIPEKCIGCKMCMRDCPANAIIINKVGDKKFSADIYLDRCVYCGQCAETCPKKAIEITANYELAALHRADLKTVTQPKPEEPKKAEEKANETAKSE